LAFLRLVGCSTDSKAVVAGTAGTAMAVPIIRPTMYDQS